MNIGILTHYDVNNQGAQLQLYAMYQQLKKLGHQPFVLTYRKNYDFEPVQELRNQITIESIPYLMKNFLFKKGIVLTWHNTKKYVLNRRFRKKEFIYASYCLTQLDAVIVGADEVFSLESGVNIMMYGHAVNTHNLIAYAPSFGQTDINRIKLFHCEELIASGLRKFRAIAVRDNHTADVINVLIGKMPLIVCDPVILYDFNIMKAKIKLPGKKYMIVYGYDRHFIDKNEIAVLKSFGKENNLLIVSPGTYHGWCDMNISCDCLQWLELFKQAEMIVVDTFHGVIVSLITNRPMAVFVRPAINSNKLTHIIRQFDITERQIKNFSLEELRSIFALKQDYQNINEQISRLRKEGLDYLKGALEQCQPG
ncbi:MAG: polysaccharide pyruvyl transferase family protein [Bacteroidales bacterium]|jgi:hypothetical protein|nr:polysaccharide pyruvyl transferase family protein [Bacteroidales bacterium]